MVRATAPASAVDLSGELFEGVPDDAMAEELTDWLAASARFRAFAEAHKAKIRKKLRGASDAEARRDVRAELRAAHLLLADRRIELAFEAYGSSKGGPDFTVAFRGERRFNVEVTRMRRPPDEAALAGQLLTKLHQMPPSVPNALLVAIDADRAEAFDVAAAARAVRARADTKDEAFFTGRGFEGTRDFYERFLRLGAVLIWCERAAGDARAALWADGSARIALPAPATRACLLCLRSS